MKVKVAQPCPTLCDPIDYTVHGILQARILEWVAFPSPGVLPDPGIEPRSPALQVDSLPSEPTGKPTSGQETFPVVVKSPLGAQAILLSTQKSQSLLLFSTFEVTMYLWDVGVQRFPWKVLISKK